MLHVVNLPWDQKAGGGGLECGVGRCEVGNRVGWAGDNYLWTTI